MNGMGERDGGSQDLPIELTGGGGKGAIMNVNGGDRKTVSTEVLTGSSDIALWFYFGIPEAHDAE